MHQVYSTLPDDRPITSIGVVEDIDKCPPDYYVVSRTHDQDGDADLWKDGFFGRKVTRYLCLSKKTGLPDYIVESIAVVSDKEVPPDGYTLLPRTIDSEQKAWRKRQLCYRLSRRSLASCSVTDVIVLSRMKKAPEGFSLAGEINGLTVCFKTGPRPTSNVTSLLPAVSLGYSLTPTTHNGTTAVVTEEDYVELRPSRAAPPRPLPPTPLGGVASASRNYATLAAFHGLEGVPFTINPNVMSLADPASVPLPSVRTWTQYQIDREFEYDFRTERQAQVSSS